MKSVVVFYVKVEDNEKFDRVVERVKRFNKDTLNKLPESVGVIWLPIKGNSQTHVEIMFLPD